MEVKERDPVSGRETTGHEWNGIKELNTPVPRPVWFFLAVTGLFSIVYWILMPAWPVVLCPVCGSRSSTATAHPRRR